MPLPAMMKPMKPEGYTRRSERPAKPQQDDIVDEFPDDDEIPF
jgi:hypothetical protein